MQPQATRQRILVVLDGDIAQLDAETRQRLLDEVREKTGDEKSSVISIVPGSILLELDVSAEAAAMLKKRPAHVAARQPRPVRTDRLSGAPWRALALLRSRGGLKRPDRVFVHDDHRVVDQREYPRLYRLVQKLEVDPAVVFAHAIGEEMPAQSSGGFRGHD
jgi:hypothetical protein